jgi:hypothetical protein
MDTEHSLLRLNAAFQEGRLFEKIVDALAKASVGAELEKEDRDSIELAIVFLSEAKQGVEWINRPTISQESKAWAKSFEMAASSIDANGDSKRFIENIDDMVKTVKALKRRKKATEPAISRVRRFFDRVFRNSIEQINEALFMQVSDKSAEWGTTHKLAI